MSGPPVARHRGPTAACFEPAARVAGPSICAGLELVGRTQLAVEGGFRRPLGTAVAHYIGDLGLAGEERLEALLIGPLVDHQYLIVAAGEGVPDRAGRLPSLGDAPHDLTSRSGGVAFQDRKSTRL